MQGSDQSETIGIAQRATAVAAVDRALAGDEPADVPTAKIRRHPPFNKGRAENIGIGRKNVGKQRDASKMRFNLTRS